jgi:ribulose-5-phosphate 4-epimerase/fuculose-1-phosphate aldolase
LLGIAGRDIEPVYSQAAFLVNGVPTFDDPRMVLDDSSAVALSKALGKAPACQMRGHGSVVVGTDAEQAFAFCTFIEENCQYQVDAAPLGGAKPFPAAMWDGLAAERRGSWGARLTWDYWERKVLAEGVGL